MTSYLDSDVNDPDVISGLIDKVDEILEGLASGIGPFLGASGNYIIGSSEDDRINQTRDTSGEYNVIWGMGGSDMISSANNEYSYIYGGTGDDVINVYDTTVSHIHGGAGDDTINVYATTGCYNGGEGADDISLYSDEGILEYEGVDDSFVDSFDSILGFVGGQHKIDLSAMNYQYNDLEFTQDGTSTIITHMASNFKILLEDFEVGNIAEADFIL